MRNGLLIFASALLAIAQGASAEVAPAIALEPGDALTVRTGPVGKPVVQRHVARWTAFDVYAARQLTGLTPPDAPVAVATPLYADTGEPNPDPVAPGELRLGFMSVAGKHSLLVVENGLPETISYRATMTVDGESRPTDVCLVKTGLPSYEHWPHPIERIALADFEYANLPPGQLPPCR